MALTGNELVELIGQSAPGIPSGESFYTTVSQIAQLSGAGGPIMTNQVKIATTGIAVPVSSSSTILVNGMVLSAAASNAAITYTSGGTGGTVGNSFVTNVTDGTGNGQIMPPGASMGIGGGQSASSIYVNGTVGDIFSFVGN